MAAAALLSSLCDVRLGMPEPLTDGDDVHAFMDQLRGMSMPQGVERYLWQADAL
jgi:hypothetical protein